MSKKNKALTSQGQSFVDIMLIFVLPIIAIILIVTKYIWQSGVAARSWNSYENFMNSCHGLEFFEIVGKTLLGVFGWLVMALLIGFAYIHLVHGIIGRLPHNTKNILALVFFLGILFFFFVL